MTACCNCRFAAFEASLQILNTQVHAYLESMMKASTAATEMANTLSGLLDADGKRTGDAAAVANAAAAATVARAMSANAKASVETVRSSLISGMVERLGEVLHRLPELAAVMKAQEDVGTDCDAYARMVRATLHHQ